MKQPFEPSNDLERALVAAQQDQMPVAAFVQVLLRSKVYLLVERELNAGSTWDHSVTSMVLTNREKTPFLALFSAAERADAWLKRQTTLGHGLSTDFAGVLQRMAPDQGIVINPGLPAGFELQPTTVAQLRVQAR